MLCIFKCPNCGGSMIYSIKERKLVCESCGSMVSGEEYDYSYLEYHGSQKIDENIYAYSCPNCGSVVMFEGTESKAICAYCNAEMAAFGMRPNEIEPEYVLPFQVTREQALVSVVKWWKNLKTMPKIDRYRDSFVFREMYVPVWLFNTNVYVGMEANVAPYESDIKHVKPSSILNGIHKVMSIRYVKVPQDGSARIEDERFHGIEPYDYSGFKVFNPAYLSGHPAERYYYSQYDIMPELIVKLRKYAVDTCKMYIEGDPKGGTIVGSKVVNLDVIPEDVTYALVPIWICTYVHKGEKHQIFVNGQTGKADGRVIFANLRLKWETAIRIVSSVFAYAGAIMLLFNWFNMMTGVFIMLAYECLIVYLTIGQNERAETTSISINEDMQVKNGKPMLVKTAVAARVIVGIISILMNTLIFGSLVGNGRGYYNALGLALGLALGVADGVMFHYKRKRFLSRRKTVDQLSYLRVCGAEQLETYSIEPQRF